MAIYHLHVKNISRREGPSAVAAAHRAGETLPNEAEEKDSAFAGKRDVVYCAHTKPERMLAADRADARAAIDRQNAIEERNRDK